MNLSPLPIQKFFADNGRPLNGGKLFTYVAGTTTKIATFTDASGGASNTNPIILNFRGECRVWLDPTLSYKFVLSPPTDTDPPTNPIWTVDDITVSPQPFDNAAVDTGTVNNITLSIPRISSPVLFTRVIFRAAFTNTGATTLQINGGTANPVTWQNAAAFAGGEIQQNGIYEAVFDGARWQLQGPTLDPTQMRTPQEAAANTVITNYAYPPGNVLRYGADPTGTLDSSLAFNRATFATYGSWVPNERPWVVHVPAGKYRIDSTVYVRSGVAILGEGMATYIEGNSFGPGTADMFIMGWGLISGVPTMDSGGYPPELANMFFNGGPSGGGACVHQNFPGGLIHDCWFAAPGLGINLAGGYVYDCEIDLGLVGMKIGPSTNQTVSNVRFFNQNFCLDFDVASTDIADCIISGCTFEYPKIAAVQLGTGAAKVRGLKFVGCDFTNNDQTFPAYVTQVSITNADCLVEFNQCTFHNWKDFALSIQTTGTVICKGCVFDRLKTHTSYQQSTTAGVATISQGTLTLSDCDFLNLANYAVSMTGASLITVNVVGGKFVSSTAARLINVTNSNTSSKLQVTSLQGDNSCPLINAQGTVRTILKGNTDWWGATGNASSRDFVLIPYGPSAAYRITLTANQNVGGSGSYRKSITMFVEKDNDFNGTAQSFLSTATVVQGAANTNGLMNMTVEFGAVGGGAAIPSSDAGMLAVSWPQAYTFETLDIEILNLG